MISDNQFRHLIIAPTLRSMDLWSQSAEDLLVMICAHESNGGDFIAQLDGPAHGVYQMEKATFNDIWRRYLFNKPDLEAKLLKACNMHHIPDAEEMDGNLYLATAMARIFFLRVYAPIPTDPSIMSHYAKKYWNTEAGKATADQYLGAYVRFTGGK